MNLTEAIEQVLLKATIPLSPAEIRFDIKQLGLIPGIDSDWDDRIKLRVQENRDKFAVNVQGLVYLEDFQQIQLTHIKGIYKEVRYVMMKEGRFESLFPLFLLVYAKHYGFPNGFLNELGLDYIPRIVSETQPTTDHRNELYKAIKTWDNSKFFSGSLHSILYDIESISIPSAGVLWDLFDHLNSKLQKLEDAKYIELFQYALNGFADNKKHGYFFTPTWIITLIKLIADEKPYSSVFNPAGGSGNILFQLDKEDKKGQNLNYEDNQENAVLIAKLNAIVHQKTKAKIHLKNSLENPIDNNELVDLVVCNPPFGLKINREERYRYSRTSVIPITNSRQFEWLFLDKALGALNRNGRAILILPEGALFNQTSKSVRRFLVSEGWLTHVISLPVGAFFPFSGIKTSILVFDATRKGEQVKYYDLEQVGESIIETISNTLEKQNLSRLTLDGLLLELNSNRKHWFREISTSEIEEKEFSLSASLYVDDFEEELQKQKEQGENLIVLNEILNLGKFPDSNYNSEIPLISSRNLSRPDGLPELADFETYRKNPARGKYQIISEPVILVNKMAGNLKPNIFRPNGREIQIHPYLWAFEWDTKKVDPEYLVMELNSEFFKKQLARISFGSAIQKVLQKSFLNLFVRLPKLEEQRRRAQDRRELILQKEKLENELRLMQEKGFRQEYNQFSGFKHNFMQNLEHLSSGLKNLNMFLERKSKSSEPFRWENKIRPAFPGQDTSSIDSVQITMERLLRNVNNTISQFEIGIEELEMQRERLSLESILLYEFFRNEIIPSFRGDARYDVFLQSASEVPELKEATVKIDRLKFKQIIRNLIDNAIKHGFEHENNKQCFVRFDFKIVEHPETGAPAICIQYHNNGKPFSIAFEEYIKPGLRTGNNSGTGLGGAFIYNTIERMGGIYRESPLLNSNEQQGIYHDIILPIS